MTAATFKIYKKHTTWQFEEVVDGSLKSVPPASPEFPKWSLECWVVWKIFTWKYVTGHVNYLFRECYVASIKREQFSLLAHCTLEGMLTPSSTCSSLDNFSAKASALAIAYSQPSIIISISCSSLAFNSWYSSTASSSPPATLWFSPLGTDS